MERAVGSGVSRTKITTPVKEKEGKKGERTVRTGST